MATRGRRRTQRANSAQGAGRPRITTPSQNRKKGRGWHTNREGGRSVLVSHLAISCRDPKQFEPTMATRGGRRTQHANSEQAAGRLRVTTPSWYYVLCCCVVVLCCTALLCCAALLCCHCPAPSSGYNTELLHRWVDTLSSDPTVTTPSCYCGLLHCCAALLCCTAVLHCCVVLLCSVRRPLRVTTLSCYTAGLIPSVVTPQLQH